jgi:hypothetical protein
MRAATRQVAAWSLLGIGDPAAAAAPSRAPDGIGLKLSPINILGLFTSLPRRCTLNFSR